MYSAVQTADRLYSEADAQNLWKTRKDTAAETVAALWNSCKYHAGWNNPAGMISNGVNKHFANLVCL